MTKMFDGPDGQDLLFSADVLCLSTIVLHSRGPSELTAGCFLVDNAADLVRVDARWRNFDNSSPLPDVKPGHLLRLTGSRIMFFMEHDPPFLGLIEPRYEILHPYEKDIEWRERMNASLDRKIHLNECFTWSTTDGETDKKQADRKPYLPVN